MKNLDQFAFFLILFFSVFIIQCSQPTKETKNEEKNTAKTLEAHPDQNEHFALTGKLSTEGDTIAKSTIKVYEDTVVIQNNELYTNQHFRLDLKFYKKYIVEFSKPGFYTKRILVNTQIPEEANKNFPPFQIEMSLYPNKADAEATQANPVGKIFYNPEIDNFDSQVFLPE